MQRAGAAAAGELSLREHRRLAGGVCVFAGPGNNGGDAWVVARALATTGARVQVIEVAVAKTPDAIAERELARSTPQQAKINGTSSEATSCAIVVDGLLGTGSSGEPRGAIADAVAAINAARARGAFVLALDLPTGVDASTGDATNAVVADLTITFGTIKRGHLVARQACGRIVVVDIGLCQHATRDDNAPALVDDQWVANHVPAIAADAHKGTRKKLAVIGGASGMAGASILAARAALRSGVGMVRLVVAPESVPIVQTAEPFALAASWPDDDAAVEREITSWADGVVIGPGLGRGREARALVDRVLAQWRGPILLDADALNVFDGDVDALARGLGTRQALITPHPAEFARLAGTDIARVLAGRFEIGATTAARLGATVLLKGVPTIVTAPNGECLVSASGTPVLAAAGSGDILSGIAGTLLAQTEQALVAGAAGAWIHGRAAELASEPIQQSALLSARSMVPIRRQAGIRGLTLENVLDSLPLGWPRSAPPSRYPVLLELPAVGERR
jgi:NAD(P)H-hydrate epimerase